MDNRIKVPDLHTYPFYSTAKVFVTYPSSPGVRYIASAYEIHNNLCATAGHVILDTNGEYFDTISVQFGYNNGNAIYTMTQDDLACYVLHGEFKGSNWKTLTEIVITI